MALQGLEDAPTRNKQLLEWVEDVAELTQPDSIEWCDGSTHEWDRLTGELVDAGTLIELNPEHRPNSFLARSSPDTPSVLRGPIPNRQSQTLSQI